MSSTHKPSQNNKSTKAGENSSGMTRRAFLGRSAMTAAATAGATTVSLAVISPKAEAGWWDVFEPAVPHTPVSIAPYYTAITVGTGYGSSVTALRLGEAGIDTLMIEMGQLWDQLASDGKVHCNMINADARSMWFKDRTEAPVSNILGLPLVDRNIDRYPGVLDTLSYDNMKVYLGRGVGGGSLVNGGMAVVPKRAFFEEILPDVGADDMYDRWYPLAQSMLHVNSVTDEVYESDYYQFSRMAETCAHKAGFQTSDVPNVYDFDYMAEEIAGNVEPSATANEVIYGNNHGKQSLDKNYIPQAIGTGNVTLRTMTRVASITQGANGVYTLQLETINVAGDIVERLSVQCRYLFLGAGTMGTTELLMRARETGALPALSDEIGQGWGNNGNFMVSIANPLWKLTGAKQSGMPVRGIDNWDDPEAQVFAEIAPFPAGIETYTSLFLAITNNPERGYMTYDATADNVRLHWGPDQSQPSFDAAKKVFDRYNKANYCHYRRGLFEGNQPYADFFTYHPLGGCLLGKATDLYGRLKGYDNLYTVDGSLIPGNVGVNPFLTITALAERNIHKILREDF
ncbi:GMC oxidoreductase [Thalassolituus sp.]|uniref:GMC oxidoreductase n=1 Tax=Thalassolituus sp. TaxID=2030822 RepID=UPI0027D6F238|nr:GMC oxidoreductase [Thalassolituus sp.]MDQ4427073.1 GMC oxidoreductase [Thalassolituus sp.]